MLWVSKNDLLVQKKANVTFTNLDPRKRGPDPANARSFSVKSTRAQKAKLWNMGSSKEKLNKTNVDDAAAEEEDLKLPNLTK